MQSCARDRHVHRLHWLSLCHGPIAEFLVTIVAGGVEPDCDAPRHPRQYPRLILHHLFAPSFGKKLACQPATDDSGPCADNFATAKVRHRQQGLAMRVVDDVGATATPPRACPGLTTPFHLPALAHSFCDSSTPCASSERLLGTVLAPYSCFCGRHVFPPRSKTYASTIRNCL